MKKWEPMPKELLDALNQHPYAEKRTDEEIAFDIKCEIEKGIDDADGIILSEKTHKLLRRFYPWLYVSLPSDKKITINSNIEEFTTEFISKKSNENIIPNSLMEKIVEKIDETKDEYFNNMRFKPIDITFAVDKSIGTFSDARLMGGSIEAKMVTSDELIKQLKGGEAMGLNIKGLTQEQLDSIKKQIEVFEKENEKPKDVIDYENGWVIAAEGVSKTSFLPSTYINNRYSLGLYRDTKEECEELIKKMKIEHRLRQWAKMCKDKVNWSDREQEKHYVYYGGTIKIDYYNTVRSNDIYFTDKSILQKAIEDIGEQKLIDEYFVEI